MKEIKIKSILILLVTCIFSVIASAQNCYVTLSQSVWEFGISGGSGQIDITPAGAPGSCSGATYTVWSVPSWLTVSVTGGTIYFYTNSSIPPGDYRTAQIPVRANGITVNGFTVKQGTEPPPPDPDPCTISGLPSSVVTFKAQGETFTYPLTFNNCSQSSATFTFTTNGTQSLPSWISVSQTGTSITVSCPPNTGPTRSSVIVGQATIGGQPVNISMQVFQQSCHINWYLDADRDGFGDPNIVVPNCNYPTTGLVYVSNNLDCDDSNPLINPNVLWYQDADGDGYGEYNGNTLSQCTQPLGYVLNNDDWCPEVVGTDYGCPNQKLTFDENYIYTLIPQIPLNNLSNRSNNDHFMESINYYDDLGRLKQSISKQAGGLRQDIITPVFYDSYGKQTKDYLPYANPTPTTPSLAIRNNSTLLTNLNNYYISNFSGDINASTPNPHSEKEIERSPLNRILKQAAPGNDWKIGSGHEIEFDYKTNALNEVRLYTVSLTSDYTPSLNNVGFYPVGVLYKTITKDENHSGTTKNHTSEEFKDKQGRVILKRTYGDSDADMNGTISGTSEVSVAHDTYYVYDRYGNLTYVIPPKVNTADGISATELSELCYQYKYDHRNRLVEKKVPGKGLESIVYDKLDRPVITFDQNLFNLHHYIITGYDAFNRVAFTGKMGSYFTRLEWQTLFDLFPTQSLERSATSTTVAGIPVYYGLGGQGQDTSAIFEVLNINYYDDYVDLPSGLSATATTYYGLISSTKTKGLPTVSKVKVLDSSTLAYITTVTYYDGKGRPIYTYVANPYLGTVDIMESKLDFTGRILESKTTHKKTGKNDIVTFDYFTYDHMGRLLTQKSKINNFADETIVSNTYDNLGQLITKGVGGKSTQGRLQTVNYTYNVRGWLKGINNESGSNSAITLGSGDLFGFQINYNAPGPGGTALFNGNISQTLWKTTSVNNTTNPVSNKYSYTYDALNRIRGAVDNTTNFNLTGVVYDKNGNITFLERRGHTTINGSGVVTAYGVMDKLDYNYYPDSNRLQNVQELTGGHAVHGFKNGSTATTEYTYDVNGNMVKDLNKGIAGANNTNGILYNHLNLPEEVKFGSTNKIKYLYDANGVKLGKQVVQEGQADKFTYYAGNYVYEGSSLKFFGHGEGYVEPVNPGNYSSGFGYVYQYKDHLGNVRLSYADSDGNGSIDPNSEIIEESNYYPFGLKQKGYNSVITSTNPAQNWKYNGKELNESLGLNWYDYGARRYDPAIGRWFTLDKMADDEMQIDKTPYAYSWNSPVTLNDPDGNCPWCIGALVGAATEYLVQAGTNLASGDSLGDALWNNIDGGDVLIAAGEGALTGGTSAIRRVAVTATAEVIKSAVDVNLDGSTDVIGTEGSNKTVSGVVKDAAIGTVTGEALGKVDLSGKLVDASSDAAVKSAKSNVTAKAKNLDKANNIRRTGNASEAASGSKAKNSNDAFKDFNKAKQAQSTTKVLNSTVGKVNDNIVKTTVNSGQGVVTKKTIDEVRKEN